ncbi:MAG: PilN domain-containing protein [Bdellovibrionaceae bacterium]|nr:PilN domain-containing protein [Pseudobdellovibrionaceae bacterium]
MVSQDLQKQAGLRLMVIISFVGLIIAYEKMQLSAKEQVIAQVRTEINQTRATKDKFGDAAPIVEKYEAEKKKLDSTIRVLEGLTENRLREVKLLDAVQSLTPARGWLEEIKVENGKASLIGYAPDEATVNALFRALEGNVLFSNVKVKSEAREVPNAGLVHRFEFTFNAGRVR